MIQMLLDIGADPERKKRRAQDALNHAITVGCQDAVPLLLTYGININHRDGTKVREVSEGRTPLQNARVQGKHAFAQVLL